MIGITSQFAERAALPFEYKMVTADITARDALNPTERYDGLFTYVVATNETWQLQGGITNADWVLISNGTAPSTQVDNEIVAGATNTFTLDAVPIAGSEHVYALGQRLYPGGVDYTILGAVITTVNAWSAGQILADYRT